MTEIWGKLGGGIENLAKRVIEGEVVFFIGAGFSLDSEGLSGPRIAERLLARLLGLLRYLKEKGMADGEEIENVFKSLFYVANFEASDMNWKNLIGKLSSEYYVFNDWIIGAFTQILMNFEPQFDVPWAKVNEFECDYISRMDKNEALDEFRFDPGGYSAQVFAKILFLDTLGIGDDKIMASCPEDKLRPRHHVLARLAREGLCPTLLTANYDMLLETGYRLAGYTYQQKKLGESDSEVNRNIDLMNMLERIGCSEPMLVRVGSGLDFFEHARSHKAAHIIKFHGCAEGYRKSKENSSCQEYLPSIVFTYREIQNWRDDAWSRDYISTLLRTRTLVFCGYSAQDPVIHDTFRNVYEEMKRRRDRQGESQIKEGKKPKTPAFAFGKHDKHEFHRSEVLRAASLAVGADNNTIGNHPNFLPIDYNSSPTMDDAFLWLYHRVQRKHQLQHLKRELFSLVQHNYPLPSRKVSKIIEDFEALNKEEEKIPENCKDQQIWEMLITRAWTWDFHAALLREFAYSISCPSSKPINYGQLMKTPWVFPASDRPDWSAWGVVIELALRNLVKKYGGKGFIEPVRGSQPSVSLVFNRDRPQITQVVVRSVVQQNAFPKKRREGGNGLELTIRLKPGSFFPDAQSDLSAAFLLECAHGNIDEKHLPDAIQRIWSRK